jgi:hypothetical protein
MATIEERMLAIEQALSMPYYKRNSELEAQIEALQGELAEAKAAHAAVMLELSNERAAHEATRAQALEERAQAQAAQSSAEDTQRQLEARLEAASIAQAEAVSEIDRLKNAFVDVEFGKLVDNQGREYDLLIKRAGLRTDYIVELVPPNGLSSLVARMLVTDGVVIDTNVNVYFEDRGIDLKLRELVK